MSLNCKQGDLAVIVRSEAGNEGAIVQCMRLLPPGTEGWETLGPRWMVDRVLNGNCGPVRSVPDARLRPLRDSDGEDEVLRLVGRPVGTPQAA
jgi:hypothetical protein